MSALQEKISTDWKNALKARDAKKDILALMKSELKSKAIATRPAGSSNTSLADEQAIEVFQKMAKQRKESIESYKLGGRQDLVDIENAELSVIQAYLPKELSDAELENLVSAESEALGASSLKDMGKVMKAVLGKAAGRADGGRVQMFVKKKLG